ncbi:MAG: hypothetical protein P1P86_07095 [Bacteroidales bacterium]|nr:hypothetical protein [Bacteroidales bacterium]
MDASDIIRLLDSRHYAPADLDEVNKLCRDFPEFSAAHILKVRIMEALGHEKQRQLKVAAVYSVDRKKLFSLVTGVLETPEPEAIQEDEGDEIIQFSEDSNQHADLIIGQHAPYLDREPSGDLLELDEEPQDELLDIVDEEPLEDSAEQSSNEELDSDMLLTPKEKDETDMEEPGESAEEELPSIDRVDQDRKKNNNHLISSFLNVEPGPIRADRETSLKGDVSLASIREHDGFITDTLAQIYVKQGLFAKAIYAYERLSLKYPEKSAYFAAQIEKIRNINHS